MPAADRKNSDLRAEIVKDKMYAEIFVKKNELRFCFGVRMFSLRHCSRRIAGLQIFFNRFINLRRAKFYAFFVQMNKVVVADNFFLNRINKPV